MLNNPPPVCLFVGPKIATTCLLNASAAWIIPVSPPTTNRALLITDRDSLKDVLPDILIISLLFLGCNNAKKSNVIGYESEDGNKVDITMGDQASLEVIVNYFEGYNNKDLEIVESLEHEDFLGFAHTGQVVEGSKQHIEMSKQFLDQFPNAKWEIVWSISSDINFRDKPTENWVTTSLNTSYGEGDNMNNFQRIFDAQIINGKIKKAYLYQRDISDRERK